ncbi:ADP-ribosylation factor [Mycena rebaudengoi]|nr:ADP-ribosylation factor [Mycena rebaudengoi]
MGATLSSVSAIGADLLLLSKPKTFGIMMIGLDDAGKTSILNRLHQPQLLGGVLPPTIPTIGFNRDIIQFGRNSITLWDIGGQDKIRPLWRSNYWNAHGFIFTVDSTTPERFSEAKEELHRMHKGLNTLGYPLLILATKTDLPEAMNISEIAEALEVGKISDLGRTLAVKGASAMTGEGLGEAIQWLVENVSHQLIAEHNAFRNRE